MNDWRSYHYSFLIGSVIQAVLVVLTLHSLYPALVASVVNLAFTLFLYPLMAVWFSKQKWSPVPPKLGPQQ
jgi:hypothetical protein